MNSQKYLAKNHYFPLFPKPGVWKVPVNDTPISNTKEKKNSTLNMIAKKLICAGRILP